MSRTVRSQDLSFLSRGAVLSDRQIDRYGRLGYYGPERQQLLRQIDANKKRNVKPKAHGLSAALSFLSNV